MTASKLQCNDKLYSSFNFLQYISAHIICIHFTCIVLETACWKLHCWKLYVWICRQSTYSVIHICSFQQWVYVPSTSVCLHCWTIPVIIPDPVQKHFGYGHYGQGATRIGPDHICWIQLPASSTVPFFQRIVHSSTVVFMEVNNSDNCFFKPLYPSIAGFSAFYQHLLHITTVHVY